MQLRERDWGFDRTQRRRLARRYRPQVYSWAVARVLAGAAVWAWVALSGISEAWYGSFGRLEAPGWAVATLFLLSLYLVLTLWNLGWGYFGSYLPGRRYKLVTASRSQWLRDRVMSFFLTAPVFVGGGLLLHRFILASPQGWWLRWSIVWVVGTFALTYAFPVLILPLFYHTEQIEQSSLRRRLQALSRRAGFDVDHIYRVDLSRRTSQINAFVTGLGSTRRIMLADNLLQQSHPAEVEAVLAHELGHHRYRHVPASALRAAAFSVLIIWISARLIPNLAQIGGYGWPATPAVLPLVGLVWIIMRGVLTPVELAICRWTERQCDAYALDICSDPSAFAAAMVRVADANLADVEPSQLVHLLLFAHPPIADRILSARSKGAQPEKVRQIIEDDQTA